LPKNLHRRLDWNLPDNKPEEGQSTPEEGVEEGSVEDTHVKFRNFVKRVADLVKKKNRTATEMPADKSSGKKGDRIFYDAKQRGEVRTTGPEEDCEPSKFISRSRRGLSPPRHDKRGKREDQLLIIPKTFTLMGHRTPDFLLRKTPRIDFDTIGYV